MSAGRLLRGSRIFAFTDDLAASGARRAAALCSRVPLHARQSQPLRDPLPPAAGKAPETRALLLSRSFVRHALFVLYDPPPANRRRLTSALGCSRSNCSGRTPGDRRPRPDRCFVFSCDVRTRRSGDLLKPSRGRGRREPATAWPPTRLDRSAPPTSPNSTSAPNAVHRMAPTPCHVARPSNRPPYPQLAAARTSTASGSIGISRRIPFARPARLCPGPITPRRMRTARARFFNGTHRGESPRGQVKVPDP